MKQLIVGIVLGSLFTTAPLLAYDYIIKPAPMLDNVAAQLPYMAATLNNIAAAVPTDDAEGQMIKNGLLASAHDLQAQSHTINTLAFDLSYYQ